GRGLGLGAGQVADVDASQVPAVRAGAGLQLLLGFRQGTPEGALAPAHAFQQELEAERGFAGAGVALDDVQVARGPAAAQHVVESGDAGRNLVDDSLAGRLGVARHAASPAPVVGKPRPRACTGCAPGVGKSVPTPGTRPAAGTN